MIQLGSQKVALVIPIATISTSILGVVVLTNEKLDVELAVSHLDLKIGFIGGNKEFKYVRHHLLQHLEH